MQPFVITKIPFMHKSEPRANLTLINYVFMVYEPLRPIGVQVPLESDSKVNSTSHYGESNAF